MLTNLERAFPDRDPAARRALAQEAARHSGAALVEGLSWSFRDASTANFEVSGADHMSELIRTQRPFIAVGAHYGVWELGLVPFEEQLDQLTVVSKAATNPYFHGESARFRRRRRFREVANQGATRHLYSALRRGESVGLVVDQRVNPEDGVLVPFLGEPAWTSTTAAALAVRCGAPILPFFVQPVGRDGYRIEYLQPVEPLADATATDVDPVLELTCRVASIQAEQIRRSPEYWFWVHDRWRRIKPYEWDETKARWRLRSRLPKRSGPEPELPEVLERWLREMQSGEPLQRGDHFRVRCAGDEGRRLVAPWAHQLIDRGRSARWLDAAEITTEEVVDWTSRRLDLFDLVIVVLDGRPPDPVARLLAGLLAHRAASRRSVMCVGPTGADDALGALAYADECAR